MADNQNVKYYCPTCKSELKLISGCGSVSYFCEKCKSLVSRSKMLSEEQVAKLKADESK